jgi:hypothetical protein
MRRISHRDRDSIHRAEALARANPKFRPGFLSIDDFTASLENTDDLAELRDALAALLARVDDTILVESAAAADSASAVYKLIQVAARLKDRDAQAAEADLASRMIKRSRVRPPKGAAGGPTVSDAAAEPARLALPGPAAGAQGCAGPGPLSSRGAQASTLPAAVSRPRRLESSLAGPESKPLRAESMPRRAESRCRRPESTPPQPESRRRRPMSGPEVPRVDATRVGCAIAPKTRPRMRKLSP